MSLAGRTDVEESEQNAANRGCPGCDAADRHCRVSRLQVIAEGIHVAAIENGIIESGVTWNSRSSVSSQLRSSTGASGETNPAARWVRVNLKEAWEYDGLVIVFLSRGEEIAFSRYCDGRKWRYPKDIGVGSTVRDCKRHLGEHEQPWVDDDGFTVVDYDLREPSAHESSGGLWFRLRNGCSDQVHINQDCRAAGITIRCSGRARRRAPHEPTS